MDGRLRAALDHLAQVPRRRAAVDRAEHALVTAARAEGASWSDVAAALGVASRQAAVQRYTRLCERLTSSDGATEPVAAAEAAPERAPEKAVPEGAPDVAPPPATGA